MSEAPAFTAVDDSVLEPRAPTENAGAVSVAQRKAGWTRLESLKWLCSFPAVLGALLVGRLFYEMRNFVADPDLWWHVRVGSDILKTHHWPTVDSYSFTAAGTPWIAYEWLGEVALAGVAKMGGLFAMAAFRFFLAAVVLLALYYLGTLRSRNCKAGFIPAALLCSLVLLSFTLRPQMFGYLFLVITLIVLEKFRQGVAWPLWLLPPMFLLWVNTHGSFIVGIAVVAIYLLSGLWAFQLGDVEAVEWTRKQRFQLELALLLCIAVLSITPYGVQLALYPFDMMFRQPLNISWITEWNVMPFDQVGGKLFLGTVAVAVAAQVLFRFRWRLEEMLLVFAGTLMACLHVRMLLIFIPFFVPVFATMAARWLPPYDRAKEHYVLNVVLISSLTAAIIYYWPSRASIEKSVNANFPVSAVAYVDSHGVPTPMLANYGFGGFLLSTGHPVFIDGRGDLYERAGVLSDFITLTQLKPGAFKVFDKYGVRSCLLLAQEPLSVVLGNSPAWRKVYTDDTAAVFVRVESGVKQ
jgi:hypothetical protein